MTQQKYQAEGKKGQYPNITAQTTGVKTMADSLAPNRSFPEGLQSPAAATEIPAEDSSVSMGSPHKKRAFGPLLPLTRESEQIVSGMRDPLSLEPEDESRKHVLLLYTTWN